MVTVDQFRKEYEDEMRQVARSIVSDALDNGFVLRNDQPKQAPELPQPQPQCRQNVLFCGLSDSPGQENLFETDGVAYCDTCGTALVLGFCQHCKT